MDKSAWAREVELAYHRTVWSAWQVGDLVNWGISLFTDGSRDGVADLVGELAEQIEVSPKTLENYARVAKRFPEDLRLGPPLTMGHHEAVVKLVDEEAMVWLQKAAEQGWSVNRLRLEVNAGGLEEPVPLPNRLAVERAFYRSGIKASLSKRRVTFVLPTGTLVLSSEADIEWGLLGPEGETDGD